MAKKSDSQRTFSVAVVGLSGTEKEKGSAGVGKSCLCNRFTRPLADEYYVDHISVLSQSDFSGRVVNNDHFLYWGEVTKTSDEGTDFHFAVIEQTEFIDDSSFQPFKSGKTEPYMKRCTATKIQSAEKLMYICKNQLGIEKEYEQKVIPEGRMNVDGFVCVLDVSVIPNRSVERQVEYVVAILNNLMKTKKPIVLATSKNDEAHELYVKEAEKLVNRKEFKGSIPIVETSAHENVNVELAFIVLAQMIDRTKGRSKITPFAEAARARREVLDVATEAYQSLIRSQVNDYRSLWNSYSKKFAQNQDFVHFCELFGHDQAQKEFRRHIKKLKEEFILKKKQTYLEDLPEVLQDLLPDISSVDSGDWPSVQHHLKEHSGFADYFVESPDDLPWQESDLVDSADSRIPFDLLESPEAELCFRNHVNTLQADQKRLDMRQQFKNLLEETGYVTPGKCLSEVHVLLIGRECYEALSEVDRQDIYDVHQKEIIDKARQNFQEVLLEHADCFYRFTSIGPSGAITQEDINKITDVLQEDSRYKALDRLDQDRKLMLFRHLGFVHCPIREHCPAFPNCMDCLIERVVATKAHRPASWSRNSQWQMNTDNNQLNLVILGSDGLADELATEIRAQCEDDEYEMDNVLYSLDYRIIDGDVNLPQNSFRTSDFLPHGITQQPEPLRGCFCVYSSTKTLEYVRESLEKTLLSNLEQEDRLPFQGLPIVILFAADPATNEKELLCLREDGQTLADNLQCPFIDITGEELSGSQQFNEIQLRQALRSLLESIQHRAGFLNIYHSLPEAAEPDIRIIMCMFCGDPYSVEHVLGPLLNHQCCFTSGERSIILETFLGDSKRRVEVIVSSYHGANAFREDLVHGFILVFSTKRKASLATLRAETRHRKAHQSARARKIAFSVNIPNLPIQILAVTESGGANAFFSSDLSHTLITEGNAIADRLQAHFMTATPTCQQKTAFYTPFFKEVWEKKPEIEQAFNMEEPVPVVGTGTLPSRDATVDRRTLPMHQVPPPPPHRRESYHIRPSSADGSADSESHYERLPTDGSQGDELDEPVSPSFIEDRPLSPSDDSDLYSNVYTQENGEHLIKPSQIKNRRSMHGDLYPESYASTESLSQKQTSSIPSDVELSYPSLPPFPGTPSPPYHFPGSPRPSHHGTGPPGLPTYRSLQRRSTGGKPVPLPRYQFKKTSSMRLASITRRDDDSDPGLPSRGHDRGFKVYPPPETPPEPAPPDTPPRRLKKATTLPSGSRTSLDDDDHGSRESLPQDPEFKRIAARKTKGWVDDSIFLRDHRDDDWVDHEHFHSYTMGRRKVPPPTKPKPGGKSKPGKLDLKNFTNVGNAIARLNLGAKEQGAPKLTKVGLHAPLATPESVELGPEYAQVKDAVPLFSTNDSEYAYAIVQDALPGNKMHRMRTQRREEKALTDSDSEWSSLERRQRDMYTKVSRKPTPHKKVRKKRSIPVAPPRVPPLPYEGLSSHLATYASERMLAAHSLDPLDKGKVVSHYRRGYYKTTWEPAEALPFRSGSPSEGSDDGTDGDVVEHYKAARPKYKPKRSFKLKKKPHSYLGNTLQHQFSSQLTSDSDLFSPSLKKLEQSAFQSQQDDDSSFEVSSPKDPNSPILFGAVTKVRGDGEKTATRRKDKKSKEDEKLEKRRQKEEEKQKRLAEKEKERLEKEKKKQKKVGTLKSATSTQQAVQMLEDFAQSDDNPIPLFLEKCIMSIEEEGLDSEGIYRVPGNRAHVDLLFQKFDEDQNISIRDLDIPVNAIATALKDFFSKRLPHLLPQEVTTELIEVAKISDRSCRLLALRSLLKKLPVSNFEILKFVFQHFVRVAENCKLNSMDSKNLAICWWPTLLPIQFTDMGEFEQMRPLLEDSVQTMIDQFRFLFCGQEEVVMV